MASKKFNFRRVAKFLLIAFLVVLLIPPAQVAIAVFWDPPFVPMRYQRRIEARMTGKTLQEAPVRWVALGDVPERLIHYIWASEDQAFFDHKGFDVPGIRTAIAEAKDGEARGVSTITMQCARSLFLWQGRSYLRKALEAYYTIWMELFMSKRRILGTLSQSHRVWSGHLRNRRCVARIFRQNSRAAHTRPNDRSGGNPAQSFEVVSRPSESDSSPQDSSRRTSFFAGSFSAGGIEGKISALACARRGA